VKPDKKPRPTAATIFVIDDDPSVRDSLRMLIESARLQVEVFDSAESFLAGFDPERPGCVVLDERMPGMSGRSLQKELLRRAVMIPVILITAHAEVPMTVDVMSLGAVTLLEKPFRDQALLDAIDEALRRDREARERARDLRDLQERLAGLTARQRQVMELLIRGFPNKRIAAELGISDRTVELHRARVVRRLEVGSVAELAYIVGRVRASELARNQAPLSSRGRPGA
jgi:RNA polymerase sigma factor (sigma-70 family)